MGARGTSADSYSLRARRVVLWHSELARAVEQVTGIEPAMTGVAHPSVTLNHLQLQESHPLESNQNLSGFSRARRPTTQEWDVASVRVDRTLAKCGCLPAPSSSSLFDCQRSARSAIEDAPRAWRSRSGVWNSGSRIAETSGCRDVRQRDGPKRRRAAWSSRAALQRRVTGYITRVESLRYPYPAPCRRNARAAARTSGSGATRYE